VRRTHLRGRLTDLERPEEWERQDLEPRVLFCLFLHSNELLITDSHRELIRLPASNRCRSCAFGTATLRDSHGSSLILANLVTLVTASSDLTSLQTLSTKSIFEGPLYQRVDKEKLLKGGDPATPSGTATLLRLHPPYRALLRRLRPLRVRPATSGAPDSGDVTGGECKARERIHRSVLTCGY